jgi:hypothetical protein
MKTIFMAGCALIALCATAHAAPKMLTAQCTDVEQPDGSTIRTCLAPGEAAWSAERPHRVFPEAPGAVIPQQQVPPAAPRVAAVPSFAPGVAPVGQAPVLPSQPIPQPDNRIRQRFLFQFGPFRFVTPPIVVGRRP